MTVVVIIDMYNTVDKALDSATGKEVDHVVVDFDLLGSGNCPVCKGDGLGERNTCEKCGISWSDDQPDGVILEAVRQHFEVD